MIRKENSGDAGEIRRVVSAAFEPVSYSDGTEPDIVDMLRDSNNMTLSLLETNGAEILGHIAFSPVTINQKDHGWYGLGPVSVRPDLQNTGIGSGLINRGLELLKERGAQDGVQGCVVLGNPLFYQRFGFQPRPDLHFEGAPAEYFMALPFTDQIPANQIPTGTVTYHKAFYIEPAPKR